MRDLDGVKIDLSTEKVKTWLEAIVYGHRVEEATAAGPVRGLQLAPAIASPTAVVMSDEFKRKHTAVYVAFLRATKWKDSKWVLATTADKKTHRVHRLEDMMTFVRGARELPHIAGVLPTYRKKVPPAATPKQTVVVGKWRLRLGTQVKTIPAR